MEAVVHRKAQATRLRQPGVNLKKRFRLRLWGPEGIGREMGKNEPRVIINSGADQGLRKEKSG